MSFRNRLTLFFVLIVIVPMVSVALVVFRLLSDSENGKRDAQVAQAQTAALGLYQESVDEAGPAAAAVSRDPAMARALGAGSATAASSRGRVLLAQLDLRRIVIVRDGRTLVDVGTRDAVAPAIRGLVGASGTPVGRLDVSTTTAASYARLVRKITGLEVIVRRGDGVPVGTIPGGDKADLPRRGKATVGGKDFRTATFKAPGPAGQELSVTVLLPANAGNLPGASRQVAALALVAFLILAFALALTVSRALAGQVGRLAEGAKRLSAGDFSTPVPSDGSDEFAKLGGEFNTMAQQLQDRLEQLEQQRHELEDSIRRIGAAAASNLDRNALLEIVLRTAVNGSGAQVGRGVARDRDHEPLSQRAVLGSVAEFADVIRSAEEQALRTGAAADAEDGDSVALAHPLGTSGRTALGVISVARRGEPFTQAERDLVHYLAAQSTVSLENVDLHELVQRQAVTDELTGLFNHRRFQEVVDSELERARRFDQPLGLVMLDIDNFKRVNDTYGHQQGDMVLREVSRVLREESREIDEPARYGGEELAVALPQTDLEGAANFAERVREAIEALALKRLDGDPEPLRVTASFGASAIPESAAGKADLIAAADAAMYRAKGSGKNRVERAAPAPTARAK